MTLPAVWLLEEPWALLGGGSMRRRIDRQLGPGENGTFTLPGAGPAAIAVGGGVMSVWWGAGREPLPALSAPFRWGSDELRTWLLPAPGIQSETERVDHDAPLGFEFDGRSVLFTLRQEGAIPRPALRNSEHAESTLSDEVQSFIDWQLGSFQELLDLSFAASLEGVPAANTDAGCVRRDWPASRAAWFRQDIDDDDPARMALVVRLSKDKRLRQVLDQTCRAPRVLLQRYRDKVPLHRVDELDAACLRWFARQPGRTIQEKAGPSQRILAIQRRQSIDTLENRILCWVLARLVYLCQRYLAQNARHAKDSERCRSVRRFGAWARSWRQAEPFASLSPRLPSPVLPNYALQEHPRYRVVWSIFKQLLRNQRVEDDAWRWQRQLWKDSAHQIFCAHLTEAMDREAPVQWASTPYIRTEIERGRWLEGPRSPGPFEFADGHIEVADPSEGPLPDPWPRWLAGLGADLLLIRRDHTGALVSATSVWFEQDWTEEQDDSGRMARCAAALRAKGRRLAEEHDEQITVDGLLLLTGGRGLADVTLDTVGGETAEAPLLVVMRIPADLHRAVDDARAGFTLVLERLLRAS